MGNLWLQLLIQFYTVLLKPCTCYLHALQTCMWFGCNFYNYFCHFSSLLLSFSYLRFYGSVYTVGTFWAHFSYTLWENAFAFEENPILISSIWNKDYFFEGSGATSSTLPTLDLFFYLFLLFFFFFNFWNFTFSQVLRKLSLFLFLLNVCLSSAIYMYTCI